MVIILNKYNIKVYVLPLRLNMKFICIFVAIWLCFIPSSLSFNFMRVGSRCIRARSPSPLLFSLTNRDNRRANVMARPIREEPQAEALFKDLFEMMEKGDTDAIRLNLENGKGKELNIINFARASNKQTLLHCASFLGHADTVSYLITQGADVNAEDNNGDTPISYAVFRGQKNVIDILLEDHKMRKEIDLFHVNAYGYTVLHIASRGGHSDILKSLLSHSKILSEEINRVSDAGDTPLAIACANQQTECVKILLEKGAVGLHTIDQATGQSPFHLLEEKNAVEISAYVSQIEKKYNQQ